MFRKEGSSTGQTATTTAASASVSGRGGRKGGGGGCGGGGGGGGRKGGGGNGKGGVATSNNSSSSKKSSARIDVPLRKSDRRRLRDRFVNDLLPHLCRHDDGGDDDGATLDQAKVEAAEKEESETTTTTTATTTTPTTPMTTEAAVTALIDDLFTNPSCDLSARKLKMPGAGNVTLYARQGKATSKDGAASASSSLSVSSRWPYRTTQIVLAEIEDDRRSSRLVPTASTLSVLPTLLPAVVVHPKTTKYLCRGADLMRSGISPASFPSSDDVSRTGGIVSIRASNNVQPFASGFVTHGTGRASVGPGAKGVAVAIVACYGDDVWREQLKLVRQNKTERSVGHGGAGAVVNPWGGGTYDDGHYGNVGFIGGASVAMLRRSGEGWEVGGVDSGEDEEENEDEEEGENGKVEEQRKQETLEGGVWDLGNVGAQVDGEGGNSAKTQSKSSSPEQAAPPPSLAEEEEEERTVGAAAASSALDAGEEIEDGVVDGKQLGSDGDGDGDGGLTSNQEGASASDAVAKEKGDNEGSNGDDVDDDDDDDNDDQSPDNILLRSFHHAVLSLNPKTDLPMPSSTFYARHILPSRPSGSTIDLKATRWKKIGPFLLEQARNGIIKIGPGADGKDKVALVTSADRTHIDLRDARKVGVGGGGGRGTKKLAIVKLYCVPPSVKSAMRLSDDAVLAPADAKSVERRRTPFLTLPECRAVLDAYIASETLVDVSDPSTAKVDGPLCDVLYKTSSKKKKKGTKDEAKPGVYPDKAGRKELHDRWVGRMGEAHAIVSMPGSIVLSLKRGPAPAIQIEVESRQGRRKFVTRVRDVEEFDIDARSFAADVSRRFGCSSTIETAEDLAPGRPALKKGRVEVVMQGHLATELTALLTGDAGLTEHGGARGAEYGVPKGAVDVKLGKNVPVRKK